MITLKEILMNKELFKKFDVRFNEPMKLHTTMEVGGPCDVMVFPHNEEEILEILQIVQRHNLPYRVIGNGSNLIVRDKGLREVVIKIHDNYSKIKRQDNYITAQAGALLKDVANFALKNGLSGMEAISGIPGDIGGAVTMNAGAYGGEIKDVLIDCKVVNKDLEVLWLKNEEMNLRYRNSRVQDEDLVVLEARFQLEPKDQKLIEEKQKEYTKKREEKQPLEYPSAGSIFKRPEGYYAGKLVDDCGFRGYQLNGAQVPEKHCGFIINREGCETKDILNLIHLIQKTVKEKFNVDLETEVRIIGEE